MQPRLMNVSVESLSKTSGHKVRILRPQMSHNGLIADTQPAVCIYCKARGSGLGREGKECP